MLDPVDIKFIMNSGELEMQSRRAVNSILGISAAGQQAAQATGTLEGRMKSLLAGFAGTAAMTGFVKQIVSVRGEIQALEASFEVLLGSKQKADEMLAAVKSYAVESPLSLSGVSGAAQTLLSFNIEAEKIIPVIKQIGDISMGNEQKFSSLVLAFSQMSSTGKLMGQDLLQMINAGFNPLTVIAEKTGKTIGELKKEMEAGAISAEMVADAFRYAASEGGKFAGMTTKQAEGIKGLEAQLGGAIQDALNDLGEKSEGVISDSYEGATALVQNYEQVGKAVFALIATYGAYKAALIALSVIETYRAQRVIPDLAARSLGLANATKTLTVAQWLSAKAQIAFNTAAKVNPYVLIATVVMGVAAAMWAMRDSTSASEKALKEYNEERERAKQAEEEHRAKIESLINAVNDEAAATYQRVIALKDLQKQYPDIFSDYDIESLKLTDILKLKQQIAEIEGKRSFQGLADEAEALRRQIGEQEKIVQRVDIGREVQLFELNEAPKRLAELREKLALVNKEILSQSSAMWETNVPFEVRSQGMRSQLDALRQQNLALDEQISRQKELNESGNLLDYRDTTLDEARFNANVKRIADLEELQKKSNTAAANDAVAKNKAYWDNIKKTSEAALAKLETASEESDEWKTLKQQIAEADGQLEKYNIKKAGKDAETAAENRLKAQQQIIEREKTLTLERQRNALDNAQKLLDIEEDGASKRLKQNELNYRLELQRIQEHVAAMEKERKRAAEDLYIKEKGSDKGFDFTKFDKEKLPEGLKSADIVKYIVDATAAADAALTYANAEVLRTLLEQYQDYGAQRLALEKKFNADVAVLQEQRATSGNAAAVDAAIAEAERQYKKALRSISDTEFEEIRKNSTLFKRLFADASQMSRERIKQTLDDAKQLLNETGFLTGQTPEAIKAIYDAIIEKQDELDSRTNYPFSGIIKGFGKLKEAADAAKKAQKEGLSQAESDMYAEQAEAARAKGLEYIKTGAVDAADALSSVTDMMQKLAEATGDSRFSDFASTMKDVSNIASATAKGAQSGGWIGALVGLGTSLAQTVTEGFAEAAAQQKQWEEDRLDFLARLREETYKLKNEDYETVFGTKSIQKASDAYRLAIQNLKKYNEEINRELAGEAPETEYINSYANPLGFITKGVDKFLRNVSGGLLGGPADLAAQKDKRIESLRKAFADGLDGLQATQVKTKDYKGFINFLGVQDQYKSLFDLAPELWNNDKNGEFNVENAKTFLETTKQISPELRRQLEEIIALKEGYDEAVKVIDAQIESVFGGLASDVTDVIFDAVRNGSNAWEEFRKVGANVIDQLGRDMIRELFVQAYFDQFKDQLREAYASDNPSESIADVLSKIMSGAETMINSAFDATVAWDEKAKQLGFDIESLYKDAESQGQEAKRGGFETASQESFDLWLGQFTAIRIHVENIYNLVASMSVGWDVTIAHLAEIERNTRDIVAVLREIDTKIKRIQNDGVKAL
jgi:tape measure domain-containing protein